jgi:hypothetical protein
MLVCKPRLFCSQATTGKGRGTGLLTAAGRIEHSCGMAVLASWLLIRACHQEILPGTSWSIAQLQQAFRRRIITNQVEHNGKTQLAKVRKMAQSFALGYGVGVERC